MWYGKKTWIKIHSNLLILFGICGPLKWGGYMILRGSAVERWMFSMWTRLQLKFSISYIVVYDSNAQIYTAVFFNFTKLTNISAYVHTILVIKYVFCIFLHIHIELQNLIDPFLILQQTWHKWRDVFQMNSSLIR